VTYTPNPVPVALAPAVIMVSDPHELQYLTDEYADIQAAFDGGLSRVYLALVEDGADLPALIAGTECDHFTVYGSLDFTPAELAIAFATWEGVKGWTTIDKVQGAIDAAQVNQCVFIENTLIAEDSRAYFGIFAFANLLSSNSWRNQQYIPISPTLGNPVELLGDAEALFDDRLSFYLTDEEQGTRLAFFVAGGKSITTPYITREIQVVMQTDMLNFLAANQPMNIETNRRLLTQIGNNVIADYLDDGLLDPDGVNAIVITKSNEAFIVDGELETTEAEALWRVKIDALQVSA